MNFRGSPNPFFFNIFFLYIFLFRFLPEEKSGIKLLYHCHWKKMVHRPPSWGFSEWKTPRRKKCSKRSDVDFFFFFLHFKSWSSRFVQQGLKIITSKPRQNLAKSAFPVPNAKPWIFIFLLTDSKYISLDPQRAQKMIFNSFGPTVKKYAVEG